MMMILTHLPCFCLCALMSFSAYGSNALRGKNFSGQEPISEAKELNINREFVKEGRKSGIDKSDIESIIPLDLGATNRGRLVRDRILAKAGSSIAKSRFIRESFLMKAAKKVQKKTALDIKIKAKPATPAPKPTSKNRSHSVVSIKKPIEHKIKFNVQAFKGKARISYSGYVQSKIEYRKQDDSFVYSVEEQLTKNSRIALTHEKNRLWKRQFLSYQLNW